jgi:subtilisin family serine protease
MSSYSKSMGLFWLAIALVAIAAGLGLVPPSFAADQRPALVSRAPLAPAPARPAPLTKSELRGEAERMPAYWLSHAVPVRGAGSVAVVARSAAALASLSRDFELESRRSAAGLAAAEIDASSADVVTLMRDPRVAFIEPVLERTSFRRRNDPLTYEIDSLTGRPYQWTFSHLGLDRALNLSKGGPDIVVGVIDSGAASIPDLQGKILERWRWTHESEAEDALGHGTFVTSLIAANNDDGRGLAGACGACRIIVFKVERLNSLAVAGAIRHLVDRGVRIINMSFGGPGVSLVELQALSYAIERGVLLVASTGNDSLAVVNFPAAALQPSFGGLGFGLAVGASDINDGRAWFSSHGERLSLVAPGAYDGGCQLAVLSAIPTPAPGYDGGCGAVYSTPDGRYTYGNGTSYSAPLVAGIAALVWAARPDLKNYEIVNVLMRSASRATAGWDPQVGWGVVAADRALELLTGRSSADALSLSRFVPDAPPTAGRTFTVRSGVHWQDGAPVAAATVRCAARVGTTNLSVVARTFSFGEARCSWRLPLAAAGRRLQGTVTVEAEGTAAQRTLAPVVRKRR